MTHKMKIGEALKMLYKNGMRIRVNFTKLNGEKREMSIQRDPVLESRVIGVSVPHYPDRLRVCEWTSEGNQWRTIPLDRVNYFICENA